MKSEAEIRKHRDALRTCRRVPCGCAGGAHEFECLVGGRMMAAAENVLSWALGENGDMDRLVEETEQVAQNFRIGLQNR